LLNQEILQGCCVPLLLFDGAELCIGLCYSHIYLFISAKHSGLVKKL
jgi:hypothetical protein